jgi:seryl-tRNA synthetase
MLDIKQIKGNKQEVQEALLKRMPSEELNLNEILELYEEYKTLLVQFEKKRSKQNSFNDKMAKLKKGSTEFKQMIEKLRDLSKEVKKLEESANQKKEDLDKKLSKLPNIPDDDIPAGGKENNEVLREWGKKSTKGFEMKSHIELGEDLGILDFERASKISGAHMPMYRGMGAVLEWAMINYFMQQHIKDGYECIIPPHLLNKQSAYVAGQLPKFEKDVYWTQEKQCLLPTAETALSNFYRDEILEEKDLPRKFFAYTPCYRKEAGAYGKEDKGLMRIHQFNKVEMFQYTTPQDAKKAFDEMVQKGEKLVQDLGLRYRVSKLAAEDMSFGMARTYDIEVYMPFLGIWKEVSSASNAHDFQARRGNMRFRNDKNNSVEYMYTLNASGLATSRLMIAVLETYQNKDGSVDVPEVLQNYVGTTKIESR